MKMPIIEDYLQAKNKLLMLQGRGCKQVKKIAENKYLRTYLLSTREAEDLNLILIGNPSYIHADLIGKTCDSIVAYELHYHREYTRKDLFTFFEENLAFKKLIEFVNETVFKNYDTLTPADLLICF